MLLKISLQQDYVQGYPWISEMTLFCAHSMHSKVWVEEAPVLLVGAFGSWLLQLF